VFFTRKRLRLYLGALLVLQLCTLISGISIARSRYIDFRTFYTASFMLRTGHAPQLYDYPSEQLFQSALVSPEPRALPLMSPPFAALPFAPLSRLGFWSAYFIFAAFNILLLLASLVLLKPFLATLSARWNTAPLLLFLTFLPAAIALIMGQLSFVLLAILCACFVLLRNQRDLLAGLLFSLALIKFQIALPIALLFLIWRQWRFFAGFLSGGTILTLISLWIIGPGNFPAYLHSLFSMTQAVTAAHSTQLHFGIIPSLMPNLYGLVFTLTHAAPWGSILILALSLLLFCWTAFQRPSLSLALLTTMLISYHLLFYDLTLLLLPLSLFADHLLRNPAPTPVTAPSHNIRLLITQISVGALLLATFIRYLISVDESCLLAIPILALTLCSTWWPALHGAPEPALLAAFAGELAPQ
jgi:hypothetical protein